MILSAHDLAGAEGVSEPIALTLPQRRFNNPLARALVEQRRDLVMDPDANRPRVATALDALLIAPEIFETPSGVYLGLKSAQTRLAEARSDQDLIGVADFLWAMALQIEDGDASQAERDLRAAEQKLREALDRGASDEEIRELMKELRAAAEKFTRELAQRPNEGRDSEIHDDPGPRQSARSHGRHGAHRRQGASPGNARSIAKSVREYEERKKPFEPG